MKPKISIITLGVSDLEKALRFYRDGLGLPTQKYKKDEGIVFFKMEGSWLALYPRDKLAEDAHTAPEGAGFSGVTLAHNVKSKEEVDRVVKLAVSAGAKLVKPPRDTSWGGIRLLRRSDGHLWEVALIRLPI